jgi:hypothetical protein
MKEKDIDRTEVERRKLIMRAKKQQEIKDKRKEVKKYNKEYVVHCYECIVVRDKLVGLERKVL